jgi:hypothetical protein
MKSGAPKSEFPAILGWCETKGWQKLCIMRYAHGWSFQLFYLFFLFGYLQMVKQNHNTDTRVLKMWHFKNVYVLLVKYPSTVYFENPISSINLEFISILQFVTFLTQNKLLLSPLHPVLQWNDNSDQYIKILYQIRITKWSAKTGPR